MPIEVTVDANPLIYLIWVAVILLGGFLIIKGLDKVRLYMTREHMHGLSRKEVKKRWAEIEVLMKQSSENAYKLAILEADKLLDHTMKSLMYSGETMGQRLKYACHKNPQLRPVWKAHIMRNKIAHEAGYRIRRNEAQFAIREFKKALRDLGAL